jgi:hypothetical protein
LQTASAVRPDFKDQANPIEREFPQAARRVLGEYDDFTASDGGGGFSFFDLGRRAAVERETGKAVLEHRNVVIAGR